MKGLVFRRYSRKQIIVMLALTLMLVAGVSYAGDPLTVPNPFTPGYTISSNSVNKNFEFVASRLGAVEIFSGIGGYINETSAAPRQLVTASFTAPQAGVILVQAFATTIESNRTNTACTMYAAIGISTATNRFDSNSYYYDSKPVTGLTRHQLNTQFMYTVSAKQAVTLYLNGYSNNSSCTGNTYYVSSPKLTVMYFPSELVVP